MGGKHEKENISSGTFFDDGSWPGRLRRRRLVRDKIDGILEGGYLFGRGFHGIRVGRRFVRETGRFVGDDLFGGIRRKRLVHGFRKSGGSDGD